MKGSELREKLHATHLPMSEIARRLGVSPQNLNSVFQSEDVKSGILEKLADALGTPITYFYGDSIAVTGSNNALATGDHSTASSADERLVTLLLNKDEQLSMSMKQLSKQQEQMDILIKKVCG